MKEKFPGYLIIVCAVLLALAIPAGAFTTDVRVVKYAPDETTVLNETTVNYTWMETNLPVMGDGVTHYYMQGPTFNESDLWDPSESCNVETRDFGALRGTDVRDLCELVGGASAGDEIMVKACDGFSKKFPYKNIYEPESRQGPAVICWYNGEESSGGDRQGTGYPPDFYTGMRLVFFADTGTNQWGYHVFGNEDMRECLDSQYWHNFSGIWPSTGGLSVKQVNDIAIYQNDKQPSATPSPEETTQKSPMSALIPLAGVGILLLCRRYW